jgi:hypothetical protein
MNLKNPKACSSIYSFPNYKNNTGFLRSDIDLGHNGLMSAACYRLEVYEIGRRNFVGHRCLVWLLPTIT